jgi:tetratricopeptide (TPR) repeat protein
MLRHISRFTFIFILATLFFQPLTLNAQQDGGNDETERLLRRNWSLFLEYFKTADYKAAKKAGWEIINLDPTRFKTLHAKLAELYDTLATNESSAEMKQAYGDTIELILDHAIKTFPDRSAEFYKQKGYHYERQFTGREADAIASYESGVNGVYTNPDDMYYYERIAILTSQIPDMKMKCIAVCQAILALDANNALAQGVLRNLISDPAEYVGILRDSYYADPENRQKLYELANGFYELVQEYDSAIVYFDKLIAIDPSVKNYWERLGACHLYLGNYSAAGKAYKKMTELDPTSKESWLNLARAVLQEGQLPEARTYAEKASELDPAWGAPRMVVAQAYEAAVQRCVERNRGGWDKMKVIDKMVYLLAQTEYSRAARDPQFADQARSRSGALSTLTPTSEDLFVNKIPKGSAYMINKDCYGWISRSVSP